MTGFATPSPRRRGKVTFVTGAPRRPRVLARAVCRDGGREEVPLARTRTIPASLVTISSDKPFEEAACERL